MFPTYIQEGLDRPSLPLSLNDQEQLNSFLGCNVFDKNNKKNIATSMLMASVNLDLLTKTILNIKGLTLVMVHLSEYIVNKSRNISQTTFIYLVLVQWQFRQNEIIWEHWAHQIYDNARDKWFNMFTLYEFQYVLNVSKRAPRQSLMKNHCYSNCIHIKLTDVLSSSPWMSLAHHTRLFAY